MQIIGHRGARGLAPENTWPAFQKALQCGVNQLEFDLRVTRDGVAVLSHSRSLTTASGRKLRVHDHTLRELRTAQPALLTFRMLLRHTGRRVRLLAEIKPGEPVEPIAAIINERLRAGWPAAAFAICSFDQAVLREVRGMLPAIELVVNEYRSGWLAALRARRLGTKRINLSRRLTTRRLLKRLQRRGYQVVPYTLNDPARIRRWQQYLYGVITDRPDRFI